jgi:hypothetical protein
MAPEERRVEINMSGIPVAGIGGLGLVAMATVVSVFFPAIGWMMAVALAGGIVLGMVLVLAGRVWKRSGPTGDDPKILFRDVPVEGRSHAEADRERPVADRDLMTARASA